MVDLGYRWAHETLFFDLFLLRHDGGYAVAQGGYRLIYVFRLV
jgi:hypothetical protein